MWVSHACCVGVGLPLTWSSRRLEGGRLFDALLKRSTCETWRHDRLQVVTGLKPSNHSAAVIGETYQKCVSLDTQHDLQAIGTTRAVEHEPTSQHIYTKMCACVCVCARKSVCEQAILLGLYAKFFVELFLRNKAVTKAFEHRWQPCLPLRPSRARHS